jgi:hypothetical protein
MSWEFKSPHPHFILMIVLNITNASKVMASKMGKFLESLTPDSFDQTMVEDAVVKALIDNLREQGLHGDVAAVRGLDLGDKELVLRDGCHVRTQHTF